MFTAKQREDAAGDTTARKISTASQIEGRLRRKSTFSTPRSKRASSHTDKKLSGHSRTDESQGGSKREEEEGKGSIPVTMVEEYSEGVKRMNGHPGIKYYA